MKRKAGHGEGGAAKGPRAGGGARFKRQKRALAEAQEVDALNQRVQECAPPEGVNPLTAAGSSTYSVCRNFEELPISQRTKEGLHSAAYEAMTAIQRAALPHALCGRDLLGAAKTGSGKTLAFLLAVIESLYRRKWTAYDGLGALILTPTRELALQIFEELQKVGKFHDLSAGLLIGGKNVKEEQERINRMNVLVCTPGRLLQHMDETPGFQSAQLQMLVLDEADRLLDMGFSATLDAILADLPRSRQTMLFSATQTKRVKDLARLSLDRPEYISVHADASEPTPLKLRQFYMTVGLNMKVDLLWSFLKSHLRSKVIIFLSTCKQVRFLHDSFRKLKPGIPLVCLHGNMKQMKRMAVYRRFCDSKAVALFATDIASRGLDFPSVDWVVQADCPENVEQYIHRVGRTARFVHGGNALLLLTSSEKDGMVQALQMVKVPIKEIKMNPEKTQIVSSALQALLSKDPQLKVYGQRAVVAYLRSIYVQPLKGIFDAINYPVAEFAQSLGLLVPPRVRFIKNGKVKNGPISMSTNDEDFLPVNGLQNGHMENHGGKAVAQKLISEDPKCTGAPTDFPDDEPSSAIETDGNGTEHSPESSMFKASGAGQEPMEMSESDEEQDLDDNFLTLKSLDVFNAIHERDETPVRGSMPANLPKKKMKIRSNQKPGQRVVFDNAGKALEPFELLASSELGDNADEVRIGSGNETGIYVTSSNPEERFQMAAHIMRDRDVQDKRLSKAARKRKRANGKQAAGVNASPVLLETELASPVEEDGMKKAHEGHIDTERHDAKERPPRTAGDDLQNISDHSFDQAYATKQPHNKRIGSSFRGPDTKDKKHDMPRSIAEQEILALQLLRRK